MTLNIRSRENSGATKKFFHSFSCAFNVFSFVPLDVMFFLDYHYLVFFPSFSFFKLLALILDVMLKARSKAMPGGRIYNFHPGKYQNFRN